MRIVITGSGLIGSYTAASLTESGHKVALFDQSSDSAYTEAVAERYIPITSGDIRDVEKLSATMSEIQPEVVIHTAGAMAGRFNREPFDSYTTNIHGSICVAEAARRNGVKRLIFCSSLAVYDFSVPASVIDEDHPTKPQSL